MSDALAELLHLIPAGWIVELRGEPATPWWHARTFLAGGHDHQWIETRSVSKTPDEAYAALTELLRQREDGS